jgi:hypothetical protein
MSKVHLDVTNLVVGNCSSFLLGENTSKILLADNQWKDYYTKDLIIGVTTTPNISVPWYITKPWAASIVQTPYVRVFEDPQVTLKNYFVEIVTETDWVAVPYNWLNHLRYENVEFTKDFGHGNPIPLN